MNFDYGLFKELSASDVWLEDKQHVYIHKETQERFISTTTALKLIKTPFEQSSVQDGLIRQYQTFLSWAETVYLPFSKVPRLLHLYVNYKNFRPYEMATWQGKEYKRYKKLNTYEYPTVLHFENEFLTIERKHKSEIDRFKNIYLNEDGSAMNKKQMGGFWQDITEIANVYGTMVHEIVEQFILLRQYFIETDSSIEKNIYNGFLDLQEKSSIFDKRYKYSLHTFEEYKINCTYEEFKNHIIEAFNSLQCDLGRVCVPEKILYHPKYKMCGTQDVYVDLSKNFFDVGDHKTNKDFETESKYGIFLKKPFDHLQQCSFNDYNIQLSTYGVINEEMSGKKVNDLWISYYNRKSSSFTRYDLPYLKDEEKELLRLFKNHIDSRLITYNKTGMLNDVPENYKNHLIHCIDGNIAQRKELGTLSDNKEDNRKYYKKFVQEYLEKQKTIKL